MVLPLSQAIPRNPPVSNYHDVVFPLDYHIQVLPRNESGRLKYLRYSWLATLAVFSILISAMYAQPGFAMVCMVWYTRS